MVTSVQSQVERELAEQPARLAQVLDREGDFAAAARAVRGRFSSIVVVARGSSRNAARYARHLFGAHHRIPVALATPSLVTRYGAPARLRDTLVIAISQSGASPDVAATVAAARDGGHPTIAITNEPRSQLADAADIVLDLDVGAETAVAATKTYTASLGAIALLDLHLGAVPAAARSQLRALPDELDVALAAPLDVAAAARGWTSAGAGLVIGRGSGHGTACEAALKLQELGGVIAQAHSAADLHHGPSAALARDVPVVLIATPGPTYADIVEVARLCIDRGALVTSVGDVGLPGGVVTLALPPLPEWLAPLRDAVVIQRLAIAVARARGRDPDLPLGITKVTRTS